MATISFTTQFNLTASPKVFVFTDTSNYPGQGIATSNVNGDFKITSPSGIVIYNNTDYTNGGCDIRVSASTQNQTSIQLPLGTDGLVEAGVYTILYTVYDKNLLVYSTVTNTYTYVYVAPVITITQSSDCLSPLFTSTDATSYVVLGITPSITRTHTLQYPLGSGASNTVTSTVTIQRGSGQYYNGTQSTEIDSYVTYTFADGLVVYDLLTGSQEFVVDCSDLCSIYCCVKTLEGRMVTYLTSNTELYLETRALFSQIMGLWGLALRAQACGKSDDVNTYIVLMKSLANCTDDCCGSGDTPTAVVGLNGIINEVIVESGDSTVVVTPVVAGNTTTYTVTIDPSFVTLVNSMYNTVVAAGTNVTSITDSGIVAGVRTFTVNAATQTGASVLYNTTTAVSTTNAAMTILQTYTLIANQLATNGDYVEIAVDFDTNATTEDKAYDVRIGGTVCHTKVTVFKQIKSQKASRLIVRATRQSVTTLFITFFQTNSNALYQTLGDGRVFYETGFSVSNLTSNTTALEIRGRNDSAGTETINAAQMVVTYYKK